MASDTAAVTLTLDKLGIGRAALVQRIDTPNAELRNRLLTLGVVAETPLEVSQVAPLGDPISISVRGVKLCLRRTEAKAVSVTEL